MTELFVLQAWREGDEGSELLLASTDEDLLKVIARETILSEMCAGDEEELNNISWDVTHVAVGS